MKKIIAIITLTACIFVGIIGCQQDIVMDNDQFRNTFPTLPTNPYNYGLQDKVPEYFKVEFAAKATRDDEGAGFINVEGQDITLDINDNIATLGRVLFYDPQLSLTGKVSCASCHRQANGFADGSALSEGFKGAVTNRNSMSITNPILNNNLFWDSRANSINDLALQPVQNHIEMGIEDMDKLETKLANIDYYSDLFSKAYGPSNPITGERIAEALTEFLASMVTYNSKFDKGMQEDFANFSPKEMLGKDLFFGAKAQCSGCHSGPNFAISNGVRSQFGFGIPSNNIFKMDPLFLNNTPNTPVVYYEIQDRTLGTANIGLHVDYADNGRERGMFKIPTLRNIGLTAPYMHDGSYETLSDVVAHYNKEIKPHENLNTRLIGQNGQPRQLGLSELEQESLVAFLHTLTDVSFVTDERFSDPFLK